MLDGLSSLFSSFADLLSPVVEFILWIFPVKVYRLHDGEAGVILTFGRTRKWRRYEVGPGVVVCFMCETLRKRQILGLYSDMPVQCLYSKDGYALMANMAAIYEIACPTTALLLAGQLEPMVEGIVMDCAREYARTHRLDDITLKKDMSKGLMKDCNDELQKWGVRVTNLVITDLRPHDVMLAGAVLDRLNAKGVRVVMARETAERPAKQSIWKEQK